MSEEQRLMALLVQYHRHREKVVNAIQIKRTFSISDIWAKQSKAKQSKAKKFFTKVQAVASMLSPERQSARLSEIKNVWVGSTPCLKKTVQNCFWKGTLSNFHQF